VRFAIIVTLAAAGAFTIARAFPQAEQRLADDGRVTSSPTSPGKTETDKPDQPPPSPKVQDVRIAVFNTTDTALLAFETGGDLEKAGYKQVQEPAQASDQLAVTAIYYSSERWKVDAEYLAQTFFKGAKVAELPPGAPDVDKDVQIAIYLGEDYASTQEK